MVKLIDFGIFALVYMETRAEYFRVHAQRYEEPWSCVHDLRADQVIGPNEQRRFFLWVPL